MPPNASRMRHVSATGVTVAQYALANVRRPSLRLALDADARVWLERVRRDGYCIVRNFFDADTCRKASAELERVFAAYPAFIHTKSDVRIFGVEAASPLLRSFYADPRLLSLASATLRAPALNAFTLGARLDYRPGNLGSGEGWHRDSFVAQFKALLYLTDVDDRSGPFQLIAASQKLTWLANDIVQARLGLLQNRVSDEQVARLLAGRPERLRTFSASAGTLLLVDTSAVHRGKPIEVGTRLSLTNYYVEAYRAGAGMDAHFAPVLRP